MAEGPGGSGGAAKNSKAAAARVTNTRMYSVDWNSPRASASSPAKIGPAIANGDESPMEYPLMSPKWLRPK